MPGGNRNRSTLRLILTAQLPLVSALAYQGTRRAEGGATALVRITLADWHWERGKNTVDTHDSKANWNVPMNCKTVETVNAALFVLSGI